MSDHEHAWGRDDLPACTPISPEVCLVREEDEAGNLRGFWISHEWAGGPVRCVGRVPVITGDHPTWAMTGTLEGGDLSLTPSILCRGGPPEHAEFHGYVTNGAWVPV